RLGHMRPTALAAPRVSASADKNSVNDSAAPSSSHTVRKGRSVTASIGARRTAGQNSRAPTRIAARRIPERRGPWRRRQRALECRGVKNRGLRGQTVLILLLAGCATTAAPPP